MSERRLDGDTTHYEVRVGGRLDPRRSAWFDGQVLTQQPDGTTLIVTQAMDQAALHGLLRQVRDAGLALISVTRVDRPEPGEAAP